MLKSKMSTAESFIALGGIIVGFTTCFIVGAPTDGFSYSFFSAGEMSDFGQIGIAQLPKCFINNDRNGIREIQTPNNAPHWDPNTAIVIISQEGFRQSATFFSEHEVNIPIGGIRDITVALLPLG